jgi:protein TonB
MERKKNEKADLEKKKGVFFQLGLVITLSLILIGFEWTSSGLSENQFDTGEGDVIDEEIIPVTRQEKPEPKTLPKPPKVTEVLNIVEDDVIIDNELILDDLESDQDEEVQILDFDVSDEEEEEAEIFFIVEDMPSFRGKGLEGFRNWVIKNLQYPEIAAENGISGTVYVQFVVEPSGMVNKVIIMRSVDPSLDKEAVRVVKTSPKWTAGKQRGKPVRVAFTFPIKFVLQ